MLAGGLGKIERLWNGHTEGLPEVAPEGVPEAVATPEGEEYDLAGTLACVPLDSLARPRASILPAARVASLSASPHARELLP